MKNGAICAVLGAVVALMHPSVSAQEVILHCKGKMLMFEQGDTKEQSTPRNMSFNVRVDVQARTVRSDFSLFTDVNVHDTAMGKGKFLVKDQNAFSLDRITGDYNEHIAGWPANKMTLWGECKPAKQMF